MILLGVPRINQCQFTRQLVQLLDEAASLAQAPCLLAAAAAAAASALWAFMANISIDCCHCLPSSCIELCRHISLTRCTLWSSVGYSLLFSGCVSIHLDSAVQLALDGCRGYHAESQQCPVPQPPSPGGTPSSSDPPLPGRTSGPLPTPAMPVPHR